MAFELPPLPYARDALAPHISAETIDYHYGKHHQTYVDNLNRLTAGTEYDGQPLETVVCNAQGGVFNNAAQIWNHSFYWNCLSPDGGGDPVDATADALTETFGSVAEFRGKFTQTAVTTFGSGWVWLVRNPDGALALESTSNAGTPLAEGKTALLTCDVWEHAYYIDHRNVRPAYMDAFWQLVNWEFVAERLATAS